MSDLPLRSDGATALRDEAGNVVGYFCPARVLDRWQARHVDLTRQAIANRQTPALEASPAADGDKPALTFDDALEMLKALADADRLRMLLTLRAGRQNVGSLAQAIGAEVVNASHHLSVLKSAKLVLSEKSGRYVYYSLNPAALQIEWVRLILESELPTAAPAAELPAEAPAAAAPEGSIEETAVPTAAVSEQPPAALPPLESAPPHEAELPAPF